MKWQDVLQGLFGSDHDVAQGGDFLQGTGTIDGELLTVVGTTNHAAVGYAVALQQAQILIDTMERHPGRPILLLIDTQGQQLRRLDELLGINRAMAHLGRCIDLARRRGHRIIGLVYDQALSGGFITSGLMADACYALPEAEIRVMRLPAMARVTKLPESMLSELSLSNPVFAPGVDNYVAMGAVRALWQGDLRTGLAEALANAGVKDVRARDGAVRGGRMAAARVIERVLEVE